MPLVMLLLLLLLFHVVVVVAVDGVKCCWGWCFFFFFVYIVSYFVAMPMPSPPASASLTKTAPPSTPLIRSTCVHTVFMRWQAKEEAEREVATLKEINSEIHAELEQALEETDQRSSSDREMVSLFFILVFCFFSGRSLRIYFYDFECLSMIQTSTVFVLPSNNQFLGDCSIHATPLP